MRASKQTGHFFSVGEAGLGKFSDMSMSFFRIFRSDGVKIFALFEFEFLLIGLLGPTLTVFRREMSSGAFFVLKGEEDKTKGGEIPSFSREFEIIFAFELGDFAVEEGSLVKSIMEGIGLILQVSFALVIS